MRRLSAIILSLGIILSAIVLWPSLPVAQGTNFLTRAVLQAGNWTLSGIVKITGQLVIPSGASDPATCDASDSLAKRLFFNTTTNLLKVCSATDTWITVGGASTVEGPASSLDNEVVVFSGATGKIIKRSDAIDPIAKRLNNVRYAAAFSSGSSTAGIIEAVADCPTNGCLILLPASESLVTATAVISKPNVTLMGSGFGSSLKRNWNPTYDANNGAVVSITATGVKLSNFTVDANRASFAGSGDAILVKNVSEIEIYGLTVKGFTVYGINLQNSQGSHIHHNRTRDGLRAGIYANNNSGSGTSSDIIIEFNDVDATTTTTNVDSGIAAISVAAGKNVNDVIIAHNRIRCGNGFCIEVNDSGGDAPLDPKIVGNNMTQSVTTTDAGGISVVRSIGGVISNNSYRIGSFSAISGIEIVEAIGVSAIGNRITGGTALTQAISVDKSSDCIVSDNLISGFKAAGFGILIQPNAVSTSTSRNIVANNRISFSTGVSGEAIRLRNSSTNTFVDRNKVEGNIISGDATAGQVGLKLGASAASTNNARFNSITGNVFHSLDSGIAIDASSTGLRTSLFSDNLFSLVTIPVNPVGSLDDISDYPDWKRPPSHLAENVPMFSFDFEDDKVDHYNTTAPLFEARGMRASYGLPLCAIPSSGLTVAQVQSLASRGHEIYSGGCNDASWIQRGGVPVTIQTIAAETFTEIARAKTYVGIDHLEHHTSPNNSLVPMKEAHCTDSRTSEQTYTPVGDPEPCRSPLAALFYDSAMQNFGSQAEPFHRTGARYEMDLWAPVLGSGDDGAAVIERIKMAMGSGQGGEWMTLAFHDIGASGYPVAQFTPIIDFVKAEQDAGRLRVVTRKEGIAAIYGSRPRNYVRNPAFAKITSTEPDQVLYWNTTSGTCGTGTYVCYEPDTDWTGRNQARFAGVGLTGQLMGMTRGEAVVCSVLVKMVRGAGTGGNGIRLIVDGATGYGADSGQTMRWSGLEQRPGNGVNGGFDIGNWADNEWGILWMQFKAMAASASMTISPNTGTCTGGPCEIVARYPTCYSLGDNWVTLNPREDFGRPVIHPIVRAKNGVVISGGGGTSCQNVEMVTSAQQTLLNYPTRVLLTKLSSTVTAGTANYKVEFFGAAGCVGTLYYPMNPDNTGTAQSITSAAFVEYPGAEYKDDTALDQNFGINVPPNPSNSNRIYFKITNNHASSVTLDLTVEALVHD